MGLLLENYVLEGDEVYRRPGSGWEGVMTAERTLAEMFRWGAQHRMHVCTRPWQPQHALLCSLHAAVVPMAAGRYAPALQ